MLITTTSIAFAFSSVGLAFCGLKFFSAFQNIGPRPYKAGLLLSTYFLLTSVQHGITAFGLIFFARNAEALYATMSLVHLILAFVAGLAVYMTIYMLIPDWSPWPITIATLAFGMFTTWWTVFTHPLPFVDVQNSINWNAPEALQLPLNFLLAISIGTPLFVFVKGFLYAPNKKTKLIFAILAIVHFAGIVNISIIFGQWIWPVSSSSNRIFDIILVIIGFLFVLTFFLVPLLKKSRE